MARNRQKAKKRQAKRKQEQRDSKPGSLPQSPAPEAESAEVEEALLAEAGAIPPEPKSAPAAREVPEPKQKPVTKQPRGRGKVLTFLGEVRAELKRVQWPDRPTLAQGTAVVVGAVLVAGFYLGALDFVWNKVVGALI